MPHERFYCNVYIGIWEYGSFTVKQDFNKFLIESNIHSLMITLFNDKDILSRPLRRGPAAGTDIGIMPTFSPC